MPLPRQVHMLRSGEGCVTPQKLLSHTPDERIQLLQNLNQFLADQMHLTTTILRAAGAIAVRASSQEVQRILQNPMVKAIRPNRKL